MKFFIAILVGCLAGAAVYLAMGRIGLKSNGYLEDLPLFAWLIGYFVTMFWLNGRGSHASVGSEPSMEQKLPAHHLQNRLPEEGVASGPGEYKSPALGMTAGILVLAAIAVGQYLMLQVIWGYGILYFVGFGFQVLDIQKEAIANGGRYSYGQDSRDAAHSFPVYSTLVSSSGAILPGRIVGLFIGIFFLIWLFLGELVRVPSLYFPLSADELGGGDGTVAVHFALTFVILFTVIISGRYTADQISRRILFLLDGRRRQGA